MAKQAQAVQDKPKSDTTATTAKATHPTTVPDYQVIKGLSGSKLPSISERLAEINRQQAELKKEADDLKSAGAEILIKHKVKSVMIGDLLVTRVDGTSASRLDRTLLLKNGVSQKVLEKSTVPGTPYVTLKVTVKKTEQEEE